MTFRTLVTSVYHMAFLSAASPETRNDIDDLYNMLQFQRNGKSVYTVIDLRTRSDWDSCHLYKAIRFESGFKKSGFKRTMVSNKRIIIICPSDTVKQNHSIIMKIKRHCKSSRTVTEFDSFCSEYPFLCCFNNVKEKGMSSSLLTYPSEIIKQRLYLGNAIHSGNIKILLDLGISHIVNVSRLMGNVFENSHAINVQYHRIPISDVRSADIEKYFESAYQYITEVLKDNGNRILVHCQHGISRSSSVVIAYLIKRHQWTLKEAHKFVKAKRRSTKPNPGFIEKLRQWEKHCSGSL